MTIKFHEPVMLKEVLKGLNLGAHLKSRVPKVIDATLGTAGHAVKIVKKADLLGIEVDGKYLEVAKKRLEEACPSHQKGLVGSFKLVNANFINIDHVARKHGFKKVDAILFDLGVNTFQLTSKKRGFSFSNPDAPLDMRLNPDLKGPKASDLLNVLREDQLFDLFEPSVGYKNAKSLVKRIVEKRKESLFSVVDDLLKLFPKKRPGKKHPATLGFMALRIAVNTELENIKEALPRAFELLKKGGRIVVITFHSGEDRIVKQYFKELEKEGLGKTLKRPILPSESEVRINPKARSAKLRWVEKVT